MIPGNVDTATHALIQEYSVPPTPMGSECQIACSRRARGHGAQQAAMGAMDGMGGMGEV